MVSQNRLFGSCFGKGFEHGIYWNGWNFNSSTLFNPKSKSNLWLMFGINPCFGFPKQHCFNSHVGINIKKYQALITEKLDFLKYSIDGAFELLYYKKILMVNSLHEKNLSLILPTFFFFFGKCNSWLCYSESNWIQLKILRKSDVFKEDLIHKFD